jgi:hypothetical protein
VKFGRTPETAFLCVFWPNILELFPFDFGSLLTYTYIPVPTKVAKYRSFQEGWPRFVVLLVDWGSQANLLSVVMALCLGITMHLPQFFGAWVRSPPLSSVFFILLTSTYEVVYWEPNFCHFPQTLSLVCAQVYRPRGVPSLPGILRRPIVMPGGCQ